MAVLSGRWVDVRAEEWRMKVCKVAGYEPTLMLGGLSLIKDQGGDGEEWRRGGTLAMWRDC